MRGISNTHLHEPWHPLIRVLILPVTFQMYSLLHWDKRLILKSLAFFPVEIFVIYSVCVFLVWEVCVHGRVCCVCF